MNFKLKIKLNGHKLYPSDNIKYLWVYLDSTLSGEAHCKVLSTKLRRANGLLSKVRHYDPKRELKSLYHALFASHLTCGLQVWGQQEKNLVMITKIQNRALRILNFQDLHADSNPLFRNDNLLKLKDIVKVKNILFIHDYLNKSLPSCFQNDFYRLENIYTSIRTRKTALGCLYVPKRGSTTYGLFCTAQKSINTWNSFTKLFNCNLAFLPKVKLKNKLKEHFLDQY